MKKSLAVFVLGPVLLYLGFGLLFASTSRYPRAVDERAHLAYVHEVSQGRLPTYHTKIDPYFGGFQKKYKHRATIWLSNHPPLFYAVQAAVAPPVIGPTRASAIDVMPNRLLSLALGVPFMIAVWFLAREALQSRPAATTATAIIALVPNVEQIFGLVFNDSLACSLCALMMLAAVRAIRAGITWKMIAYCALLAGLAMSTRATSAVVIACSGAALFIACTVSGEPWRRSALKLGVAASAWAASAAAMSGWFYLRNIRLYGDWTAADFLLREIKRTPQPLLEAIFDGGNYWPAYRGLYGPYWGNLDADKYLVMPSTLFGTVIGVSLLLAIRRFRAHQRGPRRFGRAELARALATRGGTVLVLTLYCALQVSSLVVFASKGGNIHTRYLILCLPLPAIVMAYGLRSAPRAASIALLMFMLLMNLMSLLLDADDVRDKVFGPPLFLAAIVCLVGGAALVFAAIAAAEPLAVAGAIDAPVDAPLRLAAPEPAEAPSPPAPSASPIDPDPAPDAQAEAPGEEARPDEAAPPREVPASPNDA